MVEGDTPRILQDEDTPPLLSYNTQIAAAALSCGFGLIGEKAFLDSTELLDDGAQRREVSWVFSGKDKVDFGDGEGPITFNTFTIRMRDTDWCEANPGHPVAKMAAQARKAWQLLNKLALKAPSAEFGDPLYRSQLFRREEADGSISKALVPLHYDEEEKRELLKELGYIQ